MEVGLGLVLNDKGLVLKEAAAAQYKFSASEANGLEKLTTAGLSLRWDGRGLALSEVRHGLRGVRLAGHLTNKVRYLVPFNDIEKGGQAFIL